MAARDIRAGGAFVEFSLRKDALTKGLRAVSSQLNKFGKQTALIGAKLAALGAAITTPFALALRQFLKVGDQLDKMAARTGFTVESLSALGFAAEQSGASAEVLENGIRTLQRSVNDLGRGLSTQTDAFEVLGVTFADIEKLNPERQFRLVADRISQIEDPSKRAAIAMQVLGRGGQQLLPLLNGGADGIDAFIAEAKSLGLVIDTDAAKAAARLGDLLNVLRKQFIAVAVTVGSALEPGLSRVAQVLGVVGRGIIDFVKNNKQIVTIIALIGVGVSALAVGITTLGAVAIGAAIGIKLLAGTISLILSPLGLIVGAAAAAGVALAKFTDIGGQAVGFLRNQFGRLAAFVTETFGAISNALAAGDIKLAADILWTSLKLAFVQGSSGLLETLIRLRANLLTQWNEIKTGILATVNNLKAALSRVWVGITTSASSQFSKISADARSAFNLVQLGAQKAANATRAAFDDSFDAAAANRAAEESFAQRQRDTESKDREAQARITQQRTEALKSIEADRAANEQKIADNLAANLASVNKQEADATTALTNSLASLRDRRAALLERVADSPALGGGDRFEVDGVETEFTGLGAEVRKELTKGVTNSAAIRALGNVGNNRSDEKALRTAREQVTISKEIRDAIRDGGVGVVVV